MKIIGILATVFIVELVMLFCASLTGADFLIKFTHDQSLSIMGTLLGLNLATTTFLLGNLTNVEISLNKRGLFQKTRKEIKDNVLFMLIVFVLDLFVHLLSTTAGKELITINEIKITPEQISLFFFLLYLCAAYELIRAVFKIDNLTADTK